MGQWKQEDERNRRKKCGKERIILNKQNQERECEEIGRRCAEPTDTGIRADYVRKAHRRITHKEKERLKEYTESWRRELVRYADGNILKLNEVYRKNMKEYEQTKTKKWEGSRYREKEVTKRIAVEEAERQADLDRVSVSDASVGARGRGRSGHRRMPTGEISKGSATTRATPRPRGNTRSIRTNKGGERLCGRNICSVRLPGSNSGATECKL